MIKTYSSLLEIDSFKERFEYLVLHGNVGENLPDNYRREMQELYRSSEWKSFRRDIVVRDMGLDLAHPDHRIKGFINVHHIIPITYSDIINCRRIVFDPENVISVADLTHKAIHYGNYDLIEESELVVRTKYDTCPWKKFV